LDYGYVIRKWQGYVLENQLYLDRGFKPFPKEITVWNYKIIKNEN